MCQEKERLEVPKVKTHKGAAKRFRVTGSGKIMRDKAYGGHNTGKKSGKVKRSLREPAVLASGDAARVKRLLRHA